MSWKRRTSCSHAAASPPFAASTSCQSSAIRLHPWYRLRQALRTVHQRAVLDSNQRPANPKARRSASELTARHDKDPVDADKVTPRPVIPADAWAAPTIRGTPRVATRGCELLRTVATGRSPQYGHDPEASLPPSPRHRVHGSPRGRPETFFGSGQEALDIS